MKCLDINKILFYANLSKIAYNNYVDLEMDKKYIEYIIINNHEAVVIEFENEIVISIRGTELMSISDWLTDIKLFSLNNIVKKNRCNKFYDKNIKIHNGFFEGGLELFNKIIKSKILNDNINNKPVNLIGHSAGGAKARVIAYLFLKRKLFDFDINIITFGCPKVGNRNFNNILLFYCNVYHFTHKNDIVPNTPLFSYTHRNIIEYKLMNDIIIKNPSITDKTVSYFKSLFNFRFLGVKNHFIDEYIKSLNKYKNNGINIFI